MRLVASTSRNFRQVPWRNMAHQRFGRRSLSVDADIAYLACEHAFVIIEFDAFVVVEIHSTELSSELHRIPEHSMELRRMIEHLMELSRMFRRLPQHSQSSVEESVECQNI